MAVLDSAGRVEVNLLSSQVAAHAQFGGVVPELASREHLRALPALVNEALRGAGGPPEMVAVTAGPGLVGALLVGVRFAAAFARARRLPLAAVDHLMGHLVSPFLSEHGEPAATMPAGVLALVASGGHSGWLLLEHGHATPLCRTRDDAAGETLDKVAQALGLPYPGGPVIDRLAREGNPRGVELPQPRLKDGSLAFSFSGLKSAAIRFVDQHGLRGVGEQRATQPVRDLAASLERAVVEQLLAPLPQLSARHRVGMVTASGGVSANHWLRESLEQRCHELGLELRLPARGLTTDNAAMVARAGQLAVDRGDVADPLRLDAYGREAWQPPGMRRAV